MGSKIYVWTNIKNKKKFWKKNFFAEIFRKIVFSANRYCSQQYSAHLLFASITDTAQIGARPRRTAYFHRNTGIAQSNTGVRWKKFFFDFLKNFFFTMSPWALRNPVRHLPPVGCDIQKSLQGSFKLSQGYTLYRVCCKRSWWPISVFFNYLPDPIWDNSSMTWIRISLILSSSSNLFPMILRC